MREMFSFLFSLKGNDKAVLWTEPLWVIPFNVYLPFMTLYMFNLGVDDVHIGIILSVGLVFQMIWALLGGVLTDKFGRRLTTFIGDVLAWSIPALIWAFAQNFWWFLAAAIVNATRLITLVSWECLWADDKKDEDKKTTIKIINWFHIIGQFAVFFAPIAGFFVEREGVVPVMRVLFIITFISMTIKFIITYFMTVETARGLKRMKETKNTSIFRLLLGYKRVFRQISLSPNILRVTILRSGIGIVQLITSTFFALYATQNLGINESFLAYFPILRAAIMLTFLFLIQNRLSRFKGRYVMLAGLAAHILSHGLLILSPPENLAWLSVYIIMEACAAALFLPRLDTLSVHEVRPRERARIYGVFNVIAFAVAAPFGYLAGFLSDLNRRLPFALNIVLFVCMIYFVLAKSRSKKIKAAT
ncbi:MAG: MFS transporter [Oscillospiraceae bacterium]|nr:MFS transporter [Oscillospiraceae bacterium]